MGHDPQEATALLPLPTATLHILLSLAGGDRHGYGMILEIEERTEGALRLSAGTLYRSIQRMVEQGLIRESPRRPDPDDDARRRYYAITGFGRTVAEAEADRLAALVRSARDAGLHPREAT